MTSSTRSFSRFSLLATASAFCAALIIFTGCRTKSTSLYTQVNLNTFANLSDPRMGTLTYTDDIQPLFNARCAACHSCFDAPAQLKLTSADGVERGASKELVYGTRLKETDPTRLGIDAQTTEQWREKGFFTVLGDSAATTPLERLDSSVMYQMLAMSRLRQLPTGGILDTLVKDSHDVPMAPTIAEFPDYIQKFPHAGMPFYTYGLTEDEFQTLALWIADGAKVEYKDLSFSAKEQTEINTWESLLNGDSLKDQLISRYIYEHLFAAHLYFPSLETSGFFTLVRSTTPPGEAVDSIDTRRPNDPPGVDRVYYRFEKVDNEIMRKNHLPYELTPERMAYWKELFWESDWAADEHLPTYTPHMAQRPFDVFKKIPARSRSLFLLDDNFYFVQSFIRGPVCRGQIALDCIWDQFFLYFVSPDADPFVNSETFSLNAKPNLVIPLSFSGSNDTLKYKKTMERGHTFQRQQNTAFNNQLQAEKGLNLDVIWQAREENDTPYLTVFRHFDTATVTKGFVGPTPKYGWFVDYTLFERIYYLLVVNYDVFGSVGHQLSTRLYFDFMRYEGESNYLRLFPEQDRDAMFDTWYQDVSKSKLKKHYDYLPITSANAIPYNQDNDPRDQLRNLISVVAENDGIIDDLNSIYLNLPQSTDQYVQYFPEVTFLRVRKKSGEDLVFTILRNKAMKNIAALFDEAKRREPKKDSLLVVPGLVGDYPNMMMDLTEQELDSFKQAFSNATSMSDPVSIWLKYGVLRTSPEFWPTLDWFTAWEKEQFPIQAGRFDLKHYYLTRLLNLGTADMVNK